MGGDKIRGPLDAMRDAMTLGDEERRGFTLEGSPVWLTLTELQGRLSGSPTKHVLAVWEDGVKTET